MKYKLKAKKPVSQEVTDKGIIERLEKLYIQDENPIEDPVEEPVEEPIHKVVLSIDIGIYHLGLSVVLVDEKYNWKELIWVDLIDITEFRCGKGCQLHHTKTASDWLEHVFQSEKEFFEKADVILIEKQPPMGLVAIEQVIFYRWREKAYLVSPNSIHKYFHIHTYEYEKRKEYSEKIADRFIPPHLREQLSFYERQHDITDSILFSVYWCAKQNAKVEHAERVKEQRAAYQTFLENGGWDDAEAFFAYFRYV